MSSEQDDFRRGFAMAALLIGIGRAEWLILSGSANMRSRGLREKTQALCQHDRIMLSASSLDPRTKYV